MLCLQSTEQSFLSSEDLDSAGRVFGETEKTSSVADEAGADQLSNKCGQIWGYGSHTVAEVLSELRAICRNRDNLVA